MSARGQSLDKERTKHQSHQVTAAMGRCQTQAITTTSQPTALPQNNPAPDSLKVFPSIQQTGNPTLSTQDKAPCNHTHHTTHTLLVSSVPAWCSSSQYPVQSTMHSYTPHHSHSLSPFTPCWWRDTSSKYCLVHHLTILGIKLKHC